MILVNGARVAWGGPAPTVNACEPVDVSTSGWKRVPASDSFWSLLLPPTFEIDRETPDDTQHGSVRWKSGDNVFIETLGHWGRSSFPATERSSATYSECEAMIDGERTLLMTRTDGRTYSVTAWFMELVKPRSPLVIPPATLPLFSGIGNSPDSQRFFLAILRTARFREPKDVLAARSGRRIGFADSYYCGPDEMVITVEEWSDFATPSTPPQKIEGTLRQELREAVVISASEQERLSKSVSLLGYWGSGTMSCTKGPRIRWDQRSSFLLLHLDAIRADEPGTILRLAPRDWIHFLPTK